MSLNGIVGNVRSIIEVLDGMTLVLNNKNKLYLMDQNLNVKVEHLIDNEKVCQEIGW